MTEFYPMGFGHNDPLRLEDLEDINDPQGRGRETAAARGYDVEKLMREVLDAEPSDYAFCDGFQDDALAVESKSCIDYYPCGIPGTFRIWHSHHCGMAAATSLYFFLIYTIDAETEKAKEIGKFVVRTSDMDTILEDRWNRIVHSSRGPSRYYDFSWKTLLNLLNIDVEMLQEYELVRVYGN